MQTPSTPSSFQPQSESTFLGHPRGLFLLFLVEMWERFSYYGMRGLLVLYLITTFSLHQAKPGTQANVIEFTEIKEVEKADKTKELKDASSIKRTIYVAVDDPSFKPPPDAGATVSGTPPILVERLKKVDPKATDAERTEYVVDDAPGAMITRGQAGSKASFSDTEYRFRVTNTTDEKVRLRVGVLRTNPEGKQQPTFFTINDNPESFVIELKPKKDVKPEDKPTEFAVAGNLHDSGRNWLKGDASVLYGWYTGLAYLFPILGGLIADKLIGTHRSMIVGAILISIGHVILGVSGFGDMATNQTGLTVFIMGLAVIVLGTGHFKPTVSVMVGQLYKDGDPRRDGAFTIFYMGINLGAFICAFVCGTLGEKVGWHWGFGSAAVGMILGMILYMAGKPLYLKGIGDAPRSNATGIATMFLVGSLVVSAAFAWAYHAGATATLNSMVDSLKANPTAGWSVVGVMIAGILAWATWFVSINRPEDRGPVITIFVFMFFNAFFWIAFEQAGSSLNVFTEQNTDRHIAGPGSFEVPATWFQSVNAGLIFIMAPLFAAIWTALGKRRMNPSQPVKIALGLIFLGLGYVFMVWAGKVTIGNAAKASMFYIFMCYFWHTVGELCLSPTGLSYVTKAAPVKFVSLLMGIWFVSSFIANLGGGLVAAQVEDIERGTIKLPWSFGGQADFFFLFVVTSIGAGLVILLLTPLLKKLMRDAND